jgi:hypothetical protein
LWLLEGDNPTAYAAIVFFMYFIGEAIPLFTIFYFHYRNNRTYEKNKNDNSAKNLITSGTNVTNTPVVHEYRDLSSNNNL